MGEAPKPKPPIRQNKAPEAKPEEKKPFVRKPHLTNNPFRNHPGLQALREEGRK